jgi:hypothetical protein
MGTVSPVAIEAHVSMSPPGRGMMVGDHNGPITDWPEWVSLEIQVEFELDNTRRVSTPEARYGMGGPLDCTRAELEERVRDLLFAEPRGSPPPHPWSDPLDDGPALVAHLRRFGRVESTIEALSALPLTISLDDDVAQRLRPS